MIVIVEYDMIVVVKYILVKCVITLLACFCLLRISATFSFVGTVLIRGCCLFKSLFYECNT